MLRLILINWNSKCHDHEQHVDLQDDDMGWKVEKSAALQRFHENKISHVHIVPLGWLGHSKGD